MRLVEVQQHLRNALVKGDAWPAALELSGGARALGRLRIHQRHYEASLVAVVMGRFPATGWLTGTPWLERAARDFVHLEPPSTPCIAEYGAAFPAFLAGCDGAARMPYLYDFATLEWHLGSIALAIEESAIDTSALAIAGAAALDDATVRLQGGLYYASSDWPVDQLIQLHLGSEEPASFEMSEAPVWMQVRGVRGALRFSRLAAGDFGFRLALQRQVSLGLAAAQALMIDPAFDPGRALIALVDERLLCGLDMAVGRSQSPASVSIDS